MKRILMKLLLAQGAAWQELLFILPAGLEEDGQAMKPLCVYKERRRGRGAGLNPAGRFETASAEPFDDGWGTGAELPPFKTFVQVEKARRIITSNTSPDICYDRSVNPYRGCEHGCIYCYARPSHSYMGLSAGLDFETRLFARPDAAQLLRQELSKPGYRPGMIAIGSNTDPYQPVEKIWRIMRDILSVLYEARHPVSIITKSALILRDRDLLAAMAEKKLVRVALSVTTLDARLARSMEPRAATPMRRLYTMRQLAHLGVPVSVMVAPVVPGINDNEIERILEEAANAGVVDAGYVLLRLPCEVAPLFRDWLLREYPGRYRRVMGLVRSMRGGRDYDAEWHTRMRGTGPFADMIAQRFRLACKRLALRRRPVRLCAQDFKPPFDRGKQLSLF